MTKKTLFLTASLSMLIFSGCGDDSSSAATTTTDETPLAQSNLITLSGIGQNSYLDGSVICVDANQNDQCDTNETSSTLSKGDFSFKIAETDRAYPLLIEIQDGNKLYGDDKTTVEETVTVPRVIRGLSLDDYETLGLSPTTLVTNQFGEELRNQVEMYGYDINASYQNYTEGDTNYDPMKDYQAMYQAAIADGNTTTANNYQVAREVSKIITEIKKTFMEKLSDAVENDEQRMSLNQIIGQQIQSSRSKMVTQAQIAVENGTVLSAADISNNFTSEINTSIGSDAAAYMAQAVAEVKIQQELKKRYLDNAELQALGDQNAIAKAVEEKMTDLQNSIVEEAKRLGNNADLSNIDAFLNATLGDDFANEAAKEVQAVAYEEAMQAAIQNIYAYSTQDDATKKAILDIANTIISKYRQDIADVVNNGQTFDVESALKSEDLSQARLTQYMQDSSLNTFTNFTLYDDFNGTALDDRLWKMGDSNGTLTVDHNATLSVAGKNVRESIIATSDNPVSSVEVMLSDVNVTANSPSSSVGLYVDTDVVGAGSQNYSGFSAALRIKGGEDNVSKYQVEALYSALDTNGSEASQSVIFLYEGALDENYRFNIFSDNTGIIRYRVTKQNGDQYFAEINSSAVTPNIQTAAIDKFRLGVGVEDESGFAKAGFDGVWINQNLTRLNAINGELQMENEGIQGRTCGNESCLKEKYTAMSGSPFSFYRGSAGLFYQDIAFDQIAIPASWSSNAGLSTWIQGDAHMENLGYYNENNSYEDKLQFAPNDYDESYTAPFYWDVLRFATSIRLMVDYMNGVNSGDYNGTLGSHFESVTSEQTEELVKNFTKYYMHYLEKAAADSSKTDGVLDGFDPEDSFLNPKVTGAKDGDAFMKKRFEHAEDRYIDKDGTYKTPDTYDSVSHGSDYESNSPVAKNTLAFASTSRGEFDLSDSDFEDVNGSTTPTYSAMLSMWNSQIAKDFASRNSDLSGEGNFTVKDIVRVVHKGTGSLGLDRFYVLTEGLTTSNKDDLIFQIKEEDVPSYVKYFSDINSTYPLSSNPASVVVEGFKKMTNKTDDYLTAVTLDSRNYFIQSEMNADYSLDPDNYGDKKYYVDSNNDSLGSAVDDLNNYVHYAAKAYAYAHARSMSGFATKANNFIINYGQFGEEISSLSATYFDQVKLDWQLFNAYIVPSTK